MSLDDKPFNQAILQSLNCIWKMSDSDSTGKKTSHSFSFSSAGSFLQGNPASNNQMSMSTSPTSLGTSPMNSNQMQRRSSSTYSRMAFGLYGGNSPATGLSPMPATSSSYTPPKAVSQYAPDRNEVKLSTGYELVAAAKSNETPNLFVMAGSKSLQLMKISSNEITIEGELSVSTSGQNGRNSNFGAVLDANFGFQQYGRSIAISTTSGPIHVYNLNRGNRIRTSLTDHSRAVNSVEFSNLNPYSLLSGSQDGTMKIWDLRIKNKKAQISIAGNADAVRAARFSPRAGKAIVGIFDSGVIKKWDIRKPNQYERRLNAHTGPGLTLDWHPELDYVVSGGRDKQIQVWDMSPAASENRLPDHVINTPCAVYKVSWCRGRGNGSVMTTEIASCSLNDDPCVSIWNLGRKYIPKSVIESHTNTVTSLIWKTPKHLVSCSRDKTIVQNDVTLEPETLDNLPLISTAWDGSSLSNVSFISQSKYEYQKNSNSSTSASNSSEMAPLPGPPPAGLSSSFHSHQNSFSFTNSQTPLPHPSVHQNSISSFSSFTDSKPFSIPQRSHTYKPTTPQLSRSDSHFRSMTYSNDNITPFIVGAKLELRDSDPEIFDFLSTNYLTSVPDGMDIVSTCEYNATIAASAKKFRDCQTWRSIKASILWKQSEDPELDIDFERPHVPATVMNDVQETGFSSSYLSGDDSNNYSKSRTVSALSTEESYSTNGRKTHGSESETSSNTGSKRSSFRAMSDTDRASTSAVALAQIRSRLQNSKSESLELSGRLQQLSVTPNNNTSAIDESAIDDEDEDEPNNNTSQPTDPSKGQSEESQTTNDKAEETQVGNNTTMDELQDETITNDTGNENINEADKNGIKPDVEDLDPVADHEGSITDSSPLRSSPIAIESRKASIKTRTSQQFTAYSFTGMATDFDNEKSAVSPSHNSPVSLRSIGSSVALRSDPGSKIATSALSDSVNTQLSGSFNSKSHLIAMARKSFRSNSKVSGKSGLTSMLEKEREREDEEKSTTKHQTKSESLNKEQSKSDGKERLHSVSPVAGAKSDEVSISVPWSPSQMIKEACMYSSHQGDIIMCATLALLFFDKYHNCITKEQVEDWVYSYHDILLRKCLFAAAADILRTSATYFETLRTKGQTETSFRTFCNSCGALILNEEKKEELRDDPETEFGFWYCLKCNKTQGNCIYCNEPVKGTAVALMECGHRGHYGCLHTWFVESQQTDCPTGCGTVVIH